MAIQKNITLPGNVVASYHRISGLFILDGERVCEIHLESYVDEDTRRKTVLTPEGERPKWEPVAKPVCRLSGALFNAVFGSGVPEYPQKADLYAYLKTEPQFVGAVDVV